MNTRIYELMVAGIVVAQSSSIDLLFVLQWNGGVLDVVCKGCGGCDNCTTSRRAPTCSKELGHTKGAGGHATIETLVIDPGYWRATNISRKVLKCYNPDACLGGITGASNYCRAGYEGPCEDSVRRLSS